MGGGKGRWQSSSTGREQHVGARSSNLLFLGEAGALKGTAWLHVFSDLGLLLCSSLPKGTRHGCHKAQGALAEYCQLSLNQPLGLITPVSSFVWHQPSQSTSHHRE